MPIIVSVDQAGRYFLNTSKTPEQPINAQTLMSTVNQTLTTASQHQQAQPVYVKGDKAAHYGQVVAAMVLLQKAGAKEVGLITQDPESA